MSWNSYVQQAIHTPLAGQADSVFLIGRDGALWGSSGSLPISAEESVKLAALASTLATTSGVCSPISFSISNVKFNGMIASNDDFISSGPAVNNNKMCVVGIILKKTIFVAVGNNLNVARNLNASLSKVVHLLKEQLGATIDE